MKLTSVSLVNIMYHYKPHKILKHVGGGGGGGSLPGKDAPTCKICSQTVHKTQTFFQGIKPKP